MSRPSAELPGAGSRGRRRRPHARTDGCEAVGHVALSARMARAPRGTRSVPPVPRSRVRLLAPAALLVVAAACGGGNAAIDNTNTQASSSTTTTTSPPGSNRVLHIAPVAWTLPAPLSREVLLTDGHQLVGLGGLNAAKVSSPGVFSIDPTSGAAKPLGNLNPAVH